MKGILVGIFSAVLGIEVWGWLPIVSRSLIWIETLCLPQERRALRREEWRGELEANYAERRIAGLLWVLRLAPLCLWERATTNIERRAIADPRSSSKSPVAFWSRRWQILNFAASTIRASCRLASDLLAFLGGADLSLLARVPTERRRFTALGGLSLTSGILVAVAATTLMCDWLNISLAVAASIGIVEAVGICLLQRQLMGVRRVGRRATFLIQMMPRLGLDICLGFVVSESLMLQIFRPYLLLGTGLSRLKHHVGLVEALTALHHLAATNPSLEATKVVLSICVIAMVTAPALISLISALGRPSLYQDVLTRLMIEP